MTTTLHLLESLTLDSLQIDMITVKPAEDPYGQGCASLEAHGIASDPEVAQRFAELKQSKDVVAVICAGLRVTGTISDIRPAANSDSVDIHVDVHEINYRKPTGSRITWKHA